jgi:hypothetical protein
MLAPSVLPGLVTIAFHVIGNPRRKSHTPAHLIDQMPSALELSQAQAKVPTYDGPIHKRLPGVPQLFHRR